VFAAFLFGPLVAKAVITSTIGPNTYFFAGVVLSPIAFVMLGTWYGKRVAWTHLLILSATVVIEWIRYPEHPAMNFRREISNDCASRMAVVYAAGVFLNLLIRRESDGIGATVS